MWEYDYNDTLAHHGIKGQKWGVRRFRNEDGSLTSAGKKRYQTSFVGETPKAPGTTSGPFNPGPLKAPGTTSGNINPRVPDPIVFKRSDARKKEKLEGRLARNVERQTTSDKKLFDARDKNRAKFESKYDKKIAKAEEKGDIGQTGYLKKKKEKFLEEFDKETDAYKKATAIRNENYNKILELKTKAISDPSIKSSEAYHKAEKWYRSQVVADSMYGANYTLFMEAATAYDNLGRSYTRGKLEG